MDEDLSLFELADLRRLAVEVEDALRLMKITVEGLPRSEVPAARLLHIADLERKRMRYGREINSRAAGTAADRSRSALDHARITSLHEAAVSARLMESRDALLAGLPRSIISALRQNGNPAEQLLCDLDALSSMGDLTNGDNPMVTWLRNAITLTKMRAESELFRSALDEIMRHGR